MANKIAFINGKGGCGKTTSIFHIAGVLSKAGEKVLLLDLDKQRNTTDILLMNAERPEGTIYDVLFGLPLEKATAKALFQSRGNANPKYYGVDCVASDIRLENEAELAQVDAAGFGELLSDFIKANKYTWVLVDMPPSNKVLNDICFAHIVDFLIVPFSSDVFSVSGYDDILNTVQRARTLNPSLNVLGVYLSRYWANCAVDRYIRDQLRNYDTFIDIQVPNSAEIREGVMFGRPISYYKERIVQTWVSKEGIEKLKRDGSFVSLVQTKNSLIRPTQYLVKHIHSSTFAYEKLVEYMKKRILKTGG